MSKKLLITNLLILSITLAAVLRIQARGEPELVHNPLKKLPLEIGDFFGTEDQYPESVYRVLDADTHIFRHYRKNGGVQADLYIGYYSTVKGGRSSHTPYGCLPGSGWGIIESKKEQLHPKGYRDSVQVNSIIASKGKDFLVLFHWYQVEANKVADNGIAHNLYRLKNRLINNRSDGAFVQISAFASSDQVESVREVLSEFTTSILQLMPGYWPIEIGFSWPVEKFAINAAA